MAENGTNGNGSSRVEKMLAIAASVLLIGGVLYALAVAPLTARMDAIDAKFDAMSVIAYIRAQYAHTFDQLLWRETFKSDLPGLDYWPSLGTSAGGRE